MRNLRDAGLTSSVTAAASLQTTTGVDGAPRTAVRRQHPDCVARYLINQPIRVKGKRNNSCIVPQAATAAAAALYVTDRANEQSISCRLSPHIRACSQTANSGLPFNGLHPRNPCNLITLIATHLPTLKGWKAELTWLADPQRTPYPQSGHMSTIDQESSPIKDRRSNH